MSRMTDLKITFTAYVSVSKAPSETEMDLKMRAIVAALEGNMLESLGKEEGIVFHAAKSEYEIEN